MPLPKDTRAKLLFILRELYPFAGVPDASLNKISKLDSDDIDKMLAKYADQICENFAEKEKHKEEEARKMAKWFNTIGKMKETELSKLGFNTPDSIACVQNIYINYQKNGKYTHKQILGNFDYYADCYVKSSD